MGLWVRIPPSPQRTNLHSKFYVAETFKFPKEIYYVSPSVYMSYYVYILQSFKNKSFYIGYSTDLKKRFLEHNSGKSLATNPFKPYRLIFYEAFLNKADAKNREEYLKSGWGWRSIKKLLKNYLD